MSPNRRGPKLLAPTKTTAHRTNTKLPYKLLNHLYNHLWDLKRHNHTHPATLSCIINVTVVKSSRQKFWGKHPHYHHPITGQGEGINLSALGRGGGIKCNIHYNGNCLLIWIVHLAQNMFNLLFVFFCTSSYAPSLKGNFILGYTVTVHKKKILVQLVQPVISAMKIRIKSVFMFTSSYALRLKGYSYFWKRWGYTVTVWVWVFINK